MNRDYKPGFSTEAIHAGGEWGDAFGAVNTPIVMTSSYKYDSLGDIEKTFQGDTSGYIYTRGNNPTLRVFEERMATLEGGAGAVSFATGMAAISAVIFSYVQTGDEIIASRTLYGSTYGFLTKILPRYGVKTHFCDLTDVRNIEDKLNKNTKLLYFETPCNPNLDIVDIEAAARLVRQHNPHIKVVVDNTFATPYLQKPLELGADCVVHSATKYISGHGDALGGVAIAKDEDYLRELRFTFMCDIGGALSPFNGWLFVRGLKSLPARMNQHQQSAQVIAQFLEGHKAIRSVRYPGLQNFPQHALAKRQMRGPGALLAFELHGGAEQAASLMDKFELCTLAVSLGDCETLVEHPASMTHRSYDRESLGEFGFSDATVRLSVGLEDTDDILADIDRALFRVSK